jgi:hypothetical protein
MVVVVADPVLVARRRPGGLDAPKDALVGEGGKGVVDRLPGDGPERDPHDGVDVVRGPVRLIRDRPQDRKTLSGQPKAVPAQKRIVINRDDSGRVPTLVTTLERVQIWMNTTLRQPEGAADEL